MFSFTYLRLRDSAASRHGPIRVRVADDTLQPRPTRAASFFPTFPFLSALVLSLAIAFVISLFAFALVVADLRLRSGAAWPETFAPRATFKLLRRAPSPLPLGPNGETAPFPPPYALYEVRCLSAQTQERQERQERQNRPFVRTLIFFLHGHAGARGQARHLSCAAARRAPAAKVFAFDFAEEASIHRGRLAWQQAAFAARAAAEEAEKTVKLAESVNSDESVKLVESVKSAESVKSVRSVQTAEPVKLVKSAESVKLAELVKSAESVKLAELVKSAESVKLAELVKSAELSESPSVRVWLVGHSMGGAVARLAAEFAPRVDGVVTLNAPTRAPPIFLDFAMVEMFVRLGRGAKGAAEARGEVGKDCFSQKEKPRRAAQNESAICGAERKPVVLHSITSGPLDLQVEQRLCELSPSTVNGWRWNPTHHLDDTSVCGKTLSHNDIVRDHCALMYVMDLIESRHQNTTKEPAVVGSNNVRGGVGAAHGYSVLSMLAVWAQYAVTSHTLPCAVAALYIAFVLTAFLPLARRTLLTCLPERPWATAIASTAVKAPGVLHEMRSVIGVVLSTLFLMTCGRILLFVAHCFMDMPWWYTFRETHVEHVTCASVMSALVPSLFASLGPSLCGALFSALLATALRAFVQRVTTNIARDFRVWRGEPNQRSRRCPLFISLAAPAVYVVAWLVALWGSLQLTVRALLWLLLAVILPVAKDRTGEARFIATTYALLHALHLMPFFVLRNLYISHTRDDLAMTNTMSFVPELLLHALLLLQMVKETRLFEFMVHGRPVRFGGQRYGAAVALLILALSLMHLGAVPIEACRVVWALLVGFPAFAIGVGLREAGHMSGEGVSSPFKRIRDDGERMQNYI